jgi:hypothetical protein
VQAGPRLTSAPAEQGPLRPGAIKAHVREQIAVEQHETEFDTARQALRLAGVADHFVFSPSGRPALRRPSQMRSRPAR